MFATLFYRAVVAQLDRVPDYESGGRRFESCRLHQFFHILQEPEAFMLVDPRKPRHLWMKIIILLVSLVGVFWVMNSLNDSPLVQPPAAETK